MEEKKCVHCDKYGDCLLVSNLEVAVPCTICEEYVEDEGEEKKLIDVAPLIESGWHLVRAGKSNVFLGSMSLADVPTVDAIEVVRCCDCVSCKVILDNVGAGHCHCKKRYGLPEVDPTDFCSYGERRKENA